ncbi:hypothetical protein [Mycolicibacterium mucogenicum]|uniref:Phage gp6-like head-tail connector protein n=1 Tax=Mycolicibacterium mucogenicum TaxID=56689 RepID=A0A4R5WAJ6_MYCMU|nr:hypothetical protein [Mycolicibacterium mucogenicum]TDK86279.1 hypothetical protein EUA03_19995 [Mycolicibacterium mucogenicum]
MADVLAGDVGALLGESAPTEAVLENAVKAVKMMARAYTRSVGFDGDTPNDEIAAVIVTAACRLARNPGQLGTSETMGPFTFDVRGGFQGFNLAELAALDRYRVHGL